MADLGPGFLAVRTPRSRPAYNGRFPVLSSRVALLAAPPPPSPDVVAQLIALAAIAALAALGALAYYLYANW